jgi:hypothetical protein
VTQATLANTCVVLPNRRAGLYLKKYLSAISKAPFWAPEVLSIEDFIFRLHSSVKIDRLRLLMLFYRQYLSAMGEGAEPFKSFIRWAEPLVDDFNDIDFYLVDPDALFSYLSDARALERWSPEGDSLTEMQSGYLRFYRSLAGMHQQLKREVLAEGLAWPGLAAREVLNALAADRLKPEWDKIVFAGLNALSPAEKGIIETLETYGQGETLWDADLYYLKNKEQEAGMFLRERWSENTERFHWAEEGLGTKAADVFITGVPGRIGQARKAGDILQGWLMEGKTLDEQTAVVLADETLLLPVLNSLPAEAEHVNVTMGLSLQHSPAWSFFDAWLEMLEDAIAMHSQRPVPDMGYRMRLLINWFSHPWTSLLENREDEAHKGMLTWASEEIKRTGRVILRSAQLKQALRDQWGDDALWDLLFPAVPCSPGEALNATRGLLGLLRNRLSVESANDQVGGSTLDLEYLFSIHQVITRIESLRESFSQPEDIPTLRIVLKRIAASQRLPLSGEPLQGLQVMGVLETRALDFKRVIILSANEDILPAGKHTSTFIPLDIRRDFGLPSTQERTAVFAYHFWRLMQHPAEIHILYDTQEGKLGSGEPSRFLRQIEHEWQRRNPNLRIKYAQEGLMPVMAPVEPFVVDKTDAVMERLRAMADYGLSASALSDFRACSLRFYLKRILMLEEQTPDPEEIGANVPGTLVHNVLEAMFKPFVGKCPGPDDIRGMRAKVLENTHIAFQEEFSGREHTEGRNHLLYHQAVQLVRHFLDHEEVRVAQSPSPPQIISLEDPVIVPYEFIMRQHHQNLRINLRGKSDRIEKVGEEKRIIDYKTGKVEASDLVFKDTEKVDGPKGDKIFQLMFYELIYRLKDPGLEPQMMILSLRGLSDGLLRLKGQNGEWDDTDREHFRNYLDEMLARLFDPDVQFEPTEDTDHCRWCDFRPLCYRTGGGTD